MTKLNMKHVLIRSRKSKKGRPCNGHKRTKRTNTYLQYDTQNIKNRATRALQKDKKDQHVPTI